MKWIKAILIAVPAFVGAATLIVLPTKVATAMYYYSWKWFWQKLAELLFKAAEIQLEIVRQRGYWRVNVNSAPIVTHFQGNPADAAISAENGIGFNGNTLTVAEDVVFFSDDKGGIALKQGEYAIDAQGNFQLDLISVPDPSPSKTFPPFRPTHL